MHINDDITINAVLGVLVVKNFRTKCFIIIIHTASHIVKVFFELLILQYAL